MTRYFGGKGTGIGKEIAASIVRIAGEKKTTFDSYLEPFVGMGGVMRHVVEPLKEHFPDMKFCGKDLNPGIIDFYQHICKGGNFLIANHFTQEDIDKLHKTRDKKTAMHIFTGFACGHHGRYWGDSKRPPSISHCGRWIKAANKKLEANRGTICQATYEVADIFSLPTPKNTIVYLDPPYESRGTGNLRPWGYGNQTFDSEKFWRLAEEWSAPIHNNLVLVSETTAPSGWKVVWKKTMRNREERLYMYDP